MNIPRNICLNKLLSKKHNGLIKVIAGVRRAGKSYLHFNLYKEFLITQKVPEGHTQIIS